MMENLEERIKDVMAGVLEINIASINEDSAQSNIESWDSIKTLDLIVSLEEEFDVSIPLEEVGNMTSFKFIKQMIENLL